MTLTFGSLFTGVGGFDLGLEAAGMECRWQVEYDDYCQAVLRRHWPDIPLHGDVFGVSSGTLEAVDAICGGFPCQPVSVAGQRKGTGDERWLWPEFARLVGEIRPRYVLVENVRGILSKGGSEVIADLATMGYDYEWGALSAEATGASHERERFFLVAYTTGSGAGVEGYRGTRSPRLHSPLSLQPALLRHDDRPDGAAGTHSAGADVPDPDRDRLDGSGLHEGEGQTVLLSTRSSWRGEDTGGTGSGTGAALPWKQAVDAVRLRWAEWNADDPALRPVESRVDRVANDVPHRVDRLRALGNALTPAQAEVIGRMVMAHASAIEGNKEG